MIVIVCFLIALSVTNVLALPAEVKQFVIDRGCEYPMYNTFDAGVVESATTPIIFKSVAKAKTDVDVADKAETTTHALLFNRDAYSTLENVKKTENLDSPLCHISIDTSSPIMSEVELTDPLFARTQFGSVIVSRGEKGFGAPIHHHQTVYAVRFVGTVLWSLAPPGTPIKGLAGCEEALTSTQTKLCLHEEGDILMVPKDWLHGTCHLDEWNFGFSFLLNPERRTAE